MTHYTAGELHLCEPAPVSLVSGALACRLQLLPKPGNMLVLLTSGAKQRSVQSSGGSSGTGEGIKRHLQLVRVLIPACVTPLLLLLRRAPLPLVLRRRPGLHPTLVDLTLLLRGRPGLHLTLVHNQPLRGRGASGLSGAPPTLTRPAGSRRAAPGLVPLLHNRLTPGLGLLPSNRRGGTTPGRTNSRCWPAHAGGRLPLTLSPAAPAVPHLAHTRLVSRLVLLTATSRWGLVNNRTDAIIRRKVAHCSRCRMAAIGDQRFTQSLLQPTACGHTTLPNAAASKLKAKANSRPSDAEIPAGLQKR